MSNKKKFSILIISFILLSTLMVLCGQVCNPALIFLAVIFGAGVIVNTILIAVLTISVLFEGAFD